MPGFSLGVLVTGHLVGDWASSLLRSDLNSTLTDSSKRPHHPPSPKATESGLCAELELWVCAGCLSSRQCVFAPVFPEELPAEGCVSVSLSFGVTLCVFKAVPYSI